MTYKTQKEFRSAKYKITREIVAKFADFSADQNPIHLDDKFAIDRGYSRAVSHGVIQLAFLSMIIGTKFPGPGSVWLNQQVSWVAPVLVDDEIEFLLQTKSISQSTQTATISVEIRNQRNQLVMKGDAAVRVPKEINSDTKPQQIERGKARPSKPKAFKSNGNLTDRPVAFITGATGGIGAATASALANSGFNVAINHRNQEQKAHSMIEDIRQSGGEAISISGDITNRADVSHAKKLIFDKFDRCDAIVHCATPAINPKNISELNFDDISTFIDTFLKASILLVEAFSPAMVEQRFGRFVFLGTSYLFGAPPKGVASYVAAKQALWGYTKSLAVEMAPFGITANMVSPSITVTNLTSGISARIKEVEAMKSPVRRLATIEDTACQITHLCSREANYINGINLPVTGGPI